MYDLLLVRYGEIGLKGKNRPLFEKQLADNIRRALFDLPGRRVTRTRGRVLVEDGGDMGQVMDRLRKVFGIVSMSPVKRCPPRLEAILAAAEQVMGEEAGGSPPGNGRPTTFKVEARRADKSFPWRSPDLARLLGAHLLTRIPALQVDVHDPDYLLHVEVREEVVYLYVRVVPGPGGLPVGVSGKAVLLLSGGIDSPVAGWMTMKRGVSITAVHFHSFPFTSDRSKEKVVRLCRVLSSYGRLRLSVIPFTDTQKAIQKECPEELWVTIMRRMMMRMAERLARSVGALALVTGESVGQVASQTLESLAVINEATGLPVLRPLVGLDKREIVAMAREIGTYETSVLPYEDCCALFVPRRPKTRPRLEKVREWEERLPVSALVESALSRQEVYEMGRGRTLQERPAEERPGMEGGR